MINPTLGSSKVKGYQRPRWGKGRREGKGERQRERFFFFKAVKRIEGKKDIVL